MRKGTKTALHNHIVFVVDESSSMYSDRDNVVKVVDNEVAYLARRSQELNQETRVSVYTFGSTAPDPIYYDTDVLRLPSIADDYNPGGRTALIDATIKALRDLAKTSQLYGDHAFLVYVVTDGEENQSRYRDYDLRKELEGLPVEWTVAVLVPGMRNKHAAQQCGFAPGNIAVWDPNASDGVEGAGRTVRRSTEDWMTGRARGVRGTTTLFSTGADAVNATTVRSALDPVDPDTYDVVPVPHDAYIKAFVDSLPKKTFNKGNCFYQLGSDKVAIQPTKEIYIREKSTGIFYTGPAARSILGLPDYEVKVAGDHNDGYQVFVQSTSTNRRLKAGTDLLIIKQG